MKMTDLLSEDCISVEVKSPNKEGVLSELLDILISAKKIEPGQKEELLRVLMEREKLGSTAIGNGIAIPHVKSSLVNGLVAALGISRDGVDFEALDGEKVYILFLLISPVDAAGPHLKALARISRLLKDKGFRAELSNVSSKEEALKLIEQEDSRY